MEAIKSNLSTPVSSKVVFEIWETLIPAVLNYSHIGTLFENDRHFSHLADFEREMAYRTEMVGSFRMIDNMQNNGINNILSK
ncbi:unnamed protein product [Brugia pahangi]|uniref:GLOBIN domain-containing protein n=1 Tax=Brugia pahangi TaxID=6280 RepID=A0A0N4TV60_BRUPA|nr:unnamed protein product [Brugia pahangi]